MTLKEGGDPIYRLFLAAVLLAGTAAVVPADDAKPVPTLKYADAFKRATDSRRVFILAVGEAPRDPSQFYGSPVFVCPDPPTGTAPGHYQCCATGYGVASWWKPGMEKFVPMPVPEPVLTVVKRPVWFTDYDAALKASAGKTVVVLFTDPQNCLPCRRLEAGALADPAVRDALAGCVCVRVEVRTAAGEFLRRHFARYGDPVNQWPTIKVYRGGVRVSDHSGDVPPDVFLKLIR